MKKKIKDYIRMWEKRCYSDGIPDEVPIRLMQLNKVPSYKAICIAILKNDICLKTLGYEPNKSKYYSSLKRIEIEQRENLSSQLTLF